MDVKEMHVVVTGARTGIGRAIASRLVAEGSRVSALTRDASRLDVEEGYACDIRVRAEVEAVFDRIGPLDALVANAGIGGPNEPGTGDRFEDLVATNLTGTYWCARAAQRHGVRHVIVMPRSSPASVCRLYRLLRLEGRAARARAGVDGRARGRRRDSALATLARRPRRHRPGDRPERRRVHAVGA